MRKFAKCCEGEVDIRQFASDILNGSREGRMLGQRLKGRQQRLRSRIATRIERMAEAR